VKRALRKSFYAASLDEPLETVRAFVTKYGKVFPMACGGLARDLGGRLTFHRLPQMHWKRLQMSNAIERAFRVVRCEVARFPGKTAALLIWATLEQDRSKWRGVQTDQDILKAVVELRKDGAFQRIDSSVLDAYRDAA